MKMRLRHNIAIHTIGQLLVSMMDKKFNVCAEKTPLKAPFVALANHCSDYDVFFLAKSLKFPYYFVMSDHVASIPVAGKVVDFLVSPIPITKSSKMDIKAIRGITECIKQGGSVCIFPEGNKSCAGEMSYIQPSIVKLLKHLGVPLIIYNIEGAYLSNPRWALNKKRAGKVYVKVAKVLSVEEVNKMPFEDLYKLVVSQLNVNAYDIQDANPIAYKGERLAEGFEHMFYRCPKCMSVSTIQSLGSDIKCTKCQEQWEYTEEGYLVGSYFKRLNDWDSWQKKVLKEMDFESNGIDDILLEDRPWQIAQKLTSYKSIKLGVFTSKLFKNRLLLESIEGKENIEISLNTIRGMALEGKNGIQITTNQGITYRFGNKTCLSGIKYLHYIWALLKQNMLY